MVKVKKETPEVTEKDLIKEYGEDAAADIIAEREEASKKEGKNKVVPSKETICEYYGPGYYNDEIIENRDPDNQYVKELDEFNSVLTAHKWQKLDFTEYAAKNNAASRFEEERGIKIG